MEDQYTGTINIKRNYGHLIYKTLVESKGRLNGEKDTMLQDLSILEINLKDEETHSITELVRTFIEYPTEKTYQHALKGLEVYLK